MQLVITFTLVTIDMVVHLLL